MKKHSMKLTDDDTGISVSMVGTDTKAMEKQLLRKLFTEIETRGDEAYKLKKAEEKVERLERFMDDLQDLIREYRGGGI